MDKDVKSENITVNYPSLSQLKCPHCGSGDILSRGKKGAYGKSMLMGGAMGALGNVVADATSKDDYKFEALIYKCKSCKKSFESLPFIASKEELLPEPCKIIFHRRSAVWGMAVSQSVWLNGLKVGTVKSGKDIEFYTYIKPNTICVTDQYGVAFKGDYKFDAVPGGEVEVNFKLKFV